MDESLNLSVRGIQHPHESEEVQDEMEQEEEAEEEVEEEEEVVEELEEKDMEDMEEEEEMEEEMEEEEEEMEEEEDMDDIYLENAVEFEDGTRLLYYFERIVRFLRGYIFMTTFVEQNPPEYFSGFSNMHIVHQIKNDRKVKRYRFYHLTFHFRASRFTTLS